MERESSAYVAEKKIYSAEGVDDASVVGNLFVNLQLQSRIAVDQPWTCNFGKNREPELQNLN